MEDTSEGRIPLRVAPELVVEPLGAVDGNTDQPSVFLEKPAPVVVKQGSVRLDGVHDAPPAGVLLLQLHRTPVEIQRTEEGLPSVPVEQDFRDGLRVDVLLDETLQQAVAHEVAPLSLVQVLLLQIIAVVTRQVAARSGGFRHDVQRRRERIKRSFHDGCR